MTDESDRQACYEERAAIMEYDGGLPRAEAERLAAATVKASRAQRPPPQKSLTTPPKHLPKPSGKRCSEIAKMRKLLGHSGTHSG